MLDIILIDDGDIVDFNNIPIVVTYHNRYQKEGMTSMRKKTIGEVLRLARTNQGLTLEELHKKNRNSVRYVGGNGS